jgi:hypothetical protein
MTMAPLTNGIEGDGNAEFKDDNAANDEYGSA